MDKLTELKKKIETLQAKSAVATEMKAFITLVLKVFQENKEELKSLSNEQMSVIKEAVTYISKEHKTILDTVSQETKQVKLEFAKQVKEVREFAEQIAKMKPSDGIDGKDADEEKIVKDVLSKIKFPESKEISGEEIIDLIEKLPLIPENQIDAKRIKNLPTLKGGSNISKAIYQLSDVALSNLQNNDVLKWDATNGRWVNGAGGGGSGTVTSVDMTVPTGLTISGNPITTSGTLALDLDTGYVIPLQSTLDGFVPYTGATGNVDLGANNLILDTGALVLGSGASRVDLYNISGGVAIVNSQAPGTAVAILDVSDIATSDKTFTFPNQSGTIALTTDLSGYVPYTGATQDVDLGSNALITTTLRADGSGGILLEANNGTDVALLGAGGGAGATFYGGVNIGTTTTAGTATTAFSPTMSGSSAVSNFLNITGTMPSSTSAIARAIHLSITSRGSSSNSQYLMNVSLGAGYTGSSSTVGINVANTAAGTGTGFWTNGSYNVGIYSAGSGTTAGHNVGFAGNASASSALNVGVYGRSTASTNSPNLNIGSVALATGATYNIGGFFGLFSAAPTIAQSAVVMADNGSTGSDIFVARANGTATAKIDGTGNLIWATDNTNDIGASGATRPRTGYFGTSLISPLVTTPSITSSSGAITINPAGNILNLGGGATATELRFLEPSGSGTNYTAFKAQAQSADITYTLPATVGAAGTVLTDAAGNGTLSWTTPGGGDNPTFISSGSAIIRNSGGTITQGSAAGSDEVGVYKFPDSSENFLYFPLKVPSGKTGISSIKLVIQGDGTGGNAYLIFFTSKVDVVSGGSVQVDGTDTYTAYAITANTETQIINVPSGAYNGLTGLTSDKVVYLEVGRDASSGSDTHNTTLDIVGITVTWS